MVSESLNQAVLMVPGKTYEFRMGIEAISHLFKKGDRLRLQISSSNFPEYNCKLKTEKPIGMTSKAIKAGQKVFHNSSYPSRLVLLVMPE